MVTSISTPYAKAFMVHSTVRLRQKNERLYFPAITDTVKFGNTQSQMTVYDKQNPMPDDVLISVAKLVGEVFPGESTQQKRLEEYRQLLTDEDCFISVIQENNEVIACAFAMPTPIGQRIAAITSLSVKPGERGKKNGGRILDTTCEELKTRGFTGVCLKVDSPKAEDIQRLREFYKKHLFEDFIGTEILYRDLS